MLNLTQIRKSYQIGPVSIEILKGIDLQVSEGDLLSIVGTSGSGKTTLMNIIGLLGRPDSGDYFIAGREASKLKDNDLSVLRNQQIGFVFQSFHLLPQMTALENVLLPLVYRGTSPSQMKKRAMDALARVGMEDRTEHRPDQLSGGQKQRVAIARALIGEPSLLLADEPTGALDSDTARAVLNLLKELNSKHRTTVLIITHDENIANECQRKILLDDGNITEVKPSESTSSLSMTD